MLLIIKYWISYLSNIFTKNLSIIIEDLQILKIYLRKDINQEGEALHSDCINHCLLYAFGECNHKHLDVCNNCNSFFELFDNIQNNVNADHQPIIDQ